MARILVVGDADLVNAISEIVGKRHIVVACATPEVAQRALIGGARVDAILCDAGPDGEAAAQLREQLVTGYPHHAARVGAIVRGADEGDEQTMATIPQPLDARRVLMTIERLAAVRSSAAFGAIHPKRRT